MCSTCESLLSGGFLFHLICNVVFGRSHLRAHPSVTPAWSGGAFWCNWNTNLLHSLYRPGCIAAFSALQVLLPIIWDNHDLIQLDLLYHLQN